MRTACYLRCPQLDLILDADSLRWLLQYVGQHRAQADQLLHHHQRRTLQNKTTTV